MRDYKNRSTLEVNHLKMDSAHEKLLEAFEEFELDLEAEEILGKVKRELLLKDDQLAEFAERLKQLEPEKVEAQRRRAEQAAPFQQRCYPQMTCDWFIEGLDYCCDYWRYQFKRPVTPPPAPPPSPHVRRKRGPPLQPPLQTPRELAPKRRR